MNMKQKTVLLTAACFTLGMVSAIAQAPAPRGTDSPEVEYLRRLIAAQQANPDKIIRSLPTNPPVAASTTATNGNASQPTKANPVKTSTPVQARENVSTSPKPDEAARQQKIAEVETRLDEMLKQKEAREKAALTNATASTNNIPATPQTKRQRLDALLKQMIDGTITGAEYNERRAKVIAEPD
jgi:hypothetical protein